VRLLAPAPLAAALLKLREHLRARLERARALQLDEARAREAAAHRLFAALAQLPALVVADGRDNEPKQERAESEVGDLGRDEVFHALRQRQQRRVLVMD